MSAPVNRRRFLGSMAALGLGPLRPLEAIALQPGEPSKTAQSTALQRAAHQLLERPLIFDDPVALQMLGARRVKWLALNLERYRTPSRRAWRAFLVTRSRYAEDELARTYAQGVRQYIVLGAGLDTFAYRNPHGRRLRVYEVDHPTTQAWKRAQLREHGIALPRSLTFVSVDFEKQSLAGRLQRSGVRRNAPVFISWLGVTMYLTREAVIQTLRFVAQSCARGSEIVFDFGVPDAALGEWERKLRAQHAQRVAALGEPWISYFEPAALAAELTAMGYSQAHSLGSEDLNARYFAGRADGFRLYGSGRIMTARV
jgi:methyltransferase (TIGR00027 family)